ncbi:MAG: hypothetical protein KDE14_07655, partial [Rhodobacteraceae bacterium]|nr:hypothetical protein [Paracoccaceae bacterium]
FRVGCLAGIFPFNPFFRLAPDCIHDFRDLHVGRLVLETQEFGALNLEVWTMGTVVHARAPENFRRYLLVGNQLFEPVC